MIILNRNYCNLNQIFKLLFLILNSKNKFAKKHINSTNKKNRWFTKTRNKANGKMNFKQTKN